MRTSITPGQVWLDTNGNRIHAHGGSILELDGTFYWYGENKERSTPDSGIWHWGVRCYSSTDLYNWTDRGLIIPPDVDDLASPLHPAMGMDRPHILRHPETGRYVCWIKVMSPLGQRSTVLVADDILGPYRMVRRDLKPLGMNAGDFDLVVDPTDGKGYYELICADLSEDYTDVTGYYSTHFPLYHGPWRVLNDPHPDDPSRASYHSQVSSVFRHPHKQDLYIALADRWLPRYTATSEAAIAQHAARFGPGGTLSDDPWSELTEIDTSIADYVWLPFRFEGKCALLDWHDEWRIEDYS